MENVLENAQLSNDYKSCLHR